MNWDTPFSIPIRGLHVGLHQFNFELESDFFDHFSNDDLQKGFFEVLVSLLKSQDMIQLDFLIKGYWITNCDRCLANIHLPITSKYKLLLKYSEEELDEGEIIFIKKEAPEVNLASMIYEAIIIHFPIKRVYDCEVQNPQPCDFSVLNKITENQTDENDLSVWEALKQLKVKKK